MLGHDTSRNTGSAKLNGAFQATSLILSGAIGWTAFILAAQNHHEKANRTELERLFPHAVEKSADTSVSPSPNFDSLTFPKR